MAVSVGLDDAGELGPAAAGPPGRECADCPRVVREGVQVDSAELPTGLPARAGAFVTIREGGELRGCIGTIEPIEPDVAAEIVRSAILAATADPRFAPVAASELPRLSYSVSVLEPPEEVDSIDQLDPARFGVIVLSGGRRSHRPGRTLR